jgi:hypothetical protein
VFALADSENAAEVPVPRLPEYFAVIEWGPWDNLTVKGTVAVVEPLAPPN